MCNITCPKSVLENATNGDLVLPKCQHLNNTDNKNVNSNKNKKSTENTKTNLIEGFEFGNNNTNKSENSSYTNNNNNNNNKSTENNNNNNTKNVNFFDDFGDIFSNWNNTNSNIPPKNNTDSSKIFINKLLTFFIEGSSEKRSSL